MWFLSFFFFSSRRRHTRWTGDWSSDVCSSDLALVRRIIPNTGCKVLLGLPFRVEFRNRRADRESPSKDRKVLKFIGHCVAVLRFFSRNARLVHFLCLPGNVIKHFAERSDAFLAANLAVARNKKRVLIKCGEFL